MTHTGVGVFIHQMFPLGAFGPRQWSLGELRRMFRWLRQLGYTDAIFSPVGIFRAEDEEHTILEAGALFQSGLGEKPPFTPATAYDPADRYLGTPDGLARAERFRDSLRAAKEAGLRPWFNILTTLGAPAFAEDHPELSAIDGCETFYEGIGLCPSKPAALDHLLAFYQRQIEYFDAAHGYVLWMRDPSGCRCGLCTPQPAMMVRLCNAYIQTIRQSRPQAPIAFGAWQINLSEVPELARQLDPSLLIFESPRIHAMDVRLEAFESRVEIWQSQNRRVESWLEVQENPTTLLPSIYPKRVADTVERIKRVGMGRIWVASTMTPYLFPLHLWMAPKLFADDRSPADLAAEFLRNTYGEESVPAGLHFLQTAETAFELSQAPSSRETGFLNLFVVTLPNRLLPECAIQTGVAPQARHDMEQADAAAQKALAAAAVFAEQIQQFHPLEANIIAASAEVFAHRIRMRLAKLDVLDALHRGDGDAAVSAWQVVQRACDRMVEAAQDAPNTDVLANHWRRLNLLPARLRALAALLPELADRKRFRSIRQPLLMTECYGKNSVYGNPTAE